MTWGRCAVDSPDSRGVRACGSGTGRPSCSDRRSPSSPSARLSVRRPPGAPRAAQRGRRSRRGANGVHGCARRTVSGDRGASTTPCARTTGSRVHSALGRRTGAARGTGMRGCVWIAANTAPCSTSTLSCTRATIRRSSHAARCSRCLSRSPRRRVDRCVEATTSSSMHALGLARSHVTKVPKVNVRDVGSSVWSTRTRDFFLDERSGFVGFSAKEHVSRLVRTRGAFAFDGIHTTPVEFSVECSECSHSRPRHRKAARSGWNGPPCVGPGSAALRGRSSVASDRCRST